MLKTTPLYYANQFVDNVQNAKNKFIETVVTDNKLAEPLKAFVEAQRTFTKEANRSMFEFVDTLVNSTKTAFEKTTKL